MDGSRDGWMVGSKDGQEKKGQDGADAHIDTRIQGRTDSYKEVWMERRKEGEMDGKKGQIESKREKELEENQNNNTDTSQKTDNEEGRKVIRKRTKECKGRMLKIRKEGKCIVAGNRAEKLGG